MKPYFIVSLPRCRTAWLANFLTYGPSFCFHEAWVGMDSTDALRARMKATGKKYVGNSDSGNIMFIEEIMDEFPGAKLIVIERPLDEVMASLSKADLPAPEDYLRLCQRDIMHLKLSVRPMVVNFHSLDSGALREIWSYVTDDSPIDDERLEMLESMRIEIIPEVVTKKVMANMGEIMNLLERVH